MVMMMMLIQPLVVAAVVAVSAVYAAWTLMPAALRRRLAQRLLRIPALARQPVLLRAARPASGCGCDGCDAGSAPRAGPPALPDAAQPIVIVRRQKPR